MITYALQPPVAGQVGMIVLADDGTTVFASVSVPLAGRVPSAIARALLGEAVEACRRDHFDLMGWGSRWAVEAPWPVPALPPEDLDGALYMALVALRKAQA